MTECLYNGLVQRRTIFALASILAGAAFSAIVLEAAARVYLWRLADEGQFLRYASMSQLESRYGDGTSSGHLLSPHRYLGYWPTPGYRRGKNRHDSRGFRGEEVAVPKPPGEFRIACVGGSTTYDSDIEDWAEAYPAVLEEVLRSRGHRQVRVVNAGAAGWTSWESLVNFEFRILDIDPDLVIDFDALNDVHARMVWPPGAYRGDNSGYRVPSGPDRFSIGPFERSTLLRILLIRMGLLPSPADITRSVDPTAETYFGDAWRDQVRSGTYPAGVFASTPGEVMLERNEPSYFERNVRSLVAVAKSRGVAVVLATFAYSPDFPEEPRVTRPEYRRAIDENNDVLRRVAGSTGAALFDFAHAFPTDRRWYTDGRHNTVEGARKKATMFADYLEQEGLVPPSEEPRVH